MNYEKMQQQLEALKESIQASDNLTSDTKELLNKLEKNLNEKIAAEHSEFNDVVDTAMLLETRFSIEHPMAEKILREIINTLSKIGI